MKLFNRLFVLFVFVTAALTINAQNRNSTEFTHENPISKLVSAAHDQQLTFAPAAPFQKVKEFQNPAAPLTRSISMKLQKNVISNLYARADNQILLELPGFNNARLEIELVKADLFADGFKVVSSLNPNQALDIPMGVHYRGILKGHPESIAAFSVFENQLMGMITYEGQNLVIMPSQTNVDEYLMYSDKDITIEMPFTCESLEHDEPSPQKDENDRSLTGDCVRVYIECDYALYLNKGSVTNTVAYITAVFNNVATLYTAESIATTISEVFVWQTADSYSKTSSSTALNQFRTARPTFNGDLAHLAALVGSQNLGGVAWLDALCTPYKYAYSNIYATYSNVPTYSWTVMVMTHEMGHNMGSNHTQWCGWTGGAIDNCYTTEGGCAPGPAPTNGGTIMSYCHLTQYGINLANGFGPLPGNKIRTTLAGKTCTGTSCGGGGGTCPAPTNVASSNITQTSATISWSAATGATAYKLQYKLNSSTTWTEISTTALSYNITGLTAGTLYNARVLTVCGATTSAPSGTINFTTQTSGGGGGTTYCASRGTSASQEWISRFRVNTLDRSSGNDGGYYNGTALSTTVNKGTTYSFYFQAGRTGTGRTFYWRIWIDYNKNGVFTDSGEMVISGYSNSIGLLYSNVTIPTSALTGATRVRVQMKYGGLPTSCETFARGEVEDYTLNIAQTGATLGDDQSASAPITDISVYPNPTSSIVHLNFVSDMEQKVDIKVIDLVAKTLQQQTIYSTFGLNEIELDTDKLSPGQYIIAISTGAKTEYRKLVKM